ncbi:MAG: hypothetical protein EWV41_00615 [Microcystis wesenbergii Mw_MB_S_20031200_S109]|nr:MAG: hypothetical protein EWV41_00615 [Microcystis wesenbergii Mw_MB_S_20031200_S109]
MDFTGIQKLFDEQEDRKILVHNAVVKLGVDGFVEEFGAFSVYSNICGMSVDYDLSEIGFMVYNISPNQLGEGGVYHSQMNKGYDRIASLANLSKDSKDKMDLLCRIGEMEFGKNGKVIPFLLKK